MLPLAVVHRIHLNLESLLELVNAALEEFVKVFTELNLHAEQVLLVDCQQLGVDVRARTNREAASILRVH